MKQYYFNRAKVKIGDRVSMYDSLILTITEKLISDNPSLFKEVQSPIFVKIICRPKNASWITPSHTGNSYEVEKLSDRYRIKEGNGTIPMECCKEISAKEHLDYLLFLTKKKYPVGIRLSETKHKINHKTWTIVEPSHSSDEYGIMQDGVWINRCGTWDGIYNPIFFSEENIPVYEGDHLWYVRVAPSNEYESQFDVGKYDWNNTEFVTGFPTNGYKYFTDRVKVYEFVEHSNIIIKVFDLEEIINDEELSDGEVIDSIVNLIKSKQND